MSTSKREMHVLLPEKREKAFLIAVDTGADPGWTAEESLTELASLAETAGADVVGMAWQHRDQAHPISYLGSGKALELKDEKSRLGFDLLVADDELSPKQQRNFEKLLDIKVLDRSGLILDIFAQRAHTAEGRLQVELAVLQYQLPRLTRLWTHLSRTGGGIGTRQGPGETQLETDRRVIRVRIKKMKERVAEVRQRRETAARARGRALMATIAIVGYTNAGKSTLLNVLVGEDVVEAEDKLFETLDPTSRKIALGEGQAVIATDTVGFIHKLPHQLVDAFQATLEEVTRADVLVEVVDVSDRHAPEHRRTVQTVLDELRAGDKPRVVVYNKVDLVPLEDRDTMLTAQALREGLVISAATGEGIDQLRHRLSDLLASLWVEVDVVVPYTAGELLSRVRARGTVAFEYRDSDVRVHGRVAPSLAGELETVSRSWQRVVRRAQASRVEDRAADQAEQIDNTDQSEQS